MIDYLGLVKEFHEKYNHHTQISPGNPPHTIRELRCRLIAEESDEFHYALTVEQKADAIADLLYVTFGAALAYGIPIEAVFAEVHRSNMTKSLLKNEFGKTVKGDGYEPPNIQKILNEAIRGE